ncbi:hypothetical protein ACROYT_G017626 [Oculina patagonica]
MEIVDGNCAPFSTADLLYVHCIDSTVRFEYSFSGVASLNLITVLGHVSFPSDLRSRRLVLFLDTKEIRDCLENKKSPIVCRVKASCFFEMDDGKVVVLISRIEVLPNHSLVSAPLAPRSDYEENQYPEMPWLDPETVECNCSRFPELKNVIVTKENTTKDTVNVAKEEELPVHVAVANDDDDDEEDDDVLDLEVTLYTEYVKLKGCTYHEHFQAALKSCKLKQQAGEDIPLRLYYEPTNVADENAVVAQVQFNNREWKSIGYIPGKKVQKILDALLADQVKIVKFKKIEYSFIWSINQFKYIATLVVTKQGRWPRDNDTYSYND